MITTVSLFVYVCVAFFSLHFALTVLIAGVTTPSLTCLRSGRRHSCTAGHLYAAFPCDNIVGRAASEDGGYESSGGEGSDTEDGEVNEAEASTSPTLLAFIVLTTGFW